MMRFISAILIAITLTGCDGKVSTNSSALPENVKEDRPIVLKEGQAVVLMPENNKSLMIGAAVLNGKLMIGEIDPNGRNFSVTWNDQESWETSTNISDDLNEITLFDKDGDGLPDFKVVSKDGKMERLELFDVQWKEKKNTRE
ncbi:MAG: hypothetical protein L3J39_03885 [Verrucomicrobiales bacterium]|nr:hypothetical protein [Verrucomicrobiales bacterium]